MKIIIPILSLVILGAIAWYLMQQQATTQAVAPPLDYRAEEYEAVQNNPEKLAQGKLIYITQCQVCHGNLGQGLVGPNLADKFWIHGKGTLEDIAKVVNSGVLDKAMPAWGKVLKHEDFVDVVGYIKTLQGTNPPGAKAAEGIEQP